MSGRPLEYLLDISVAAALRPAAARALASAGCYCTIFLFRGLRAAAPALPGQVKGLSSAANHILSVSQVVAALLAAAAMLFC